MYWFGPSKWSLACDEMPRAEIPAGMLCGRCQEPIEPGSSGVLMQHFSPSTPLPRVLLLPYHEECHLRGILGGVNHLRGKCTCCGGNQPPDPEGLTSREAAKMAVDFYRGRITDR